MNKTQIPNFENYYITEEGFVSHNNKPIKAYMTKTNIPSVRLRKDGEYYTFSIAKVVALTFLRDTRKYPSDVVSYKDGNNHNFHKDNLYWTSRSEAYSKMYNKENRYSVKRLEKLRQKICRPVVSLARYENDYAVINRYNSVTDAAKDMGVAPASLIRCLKNQKYMCAGLHWRYDDKENE